VNVPRSAVPAVTHVDYSARLQTVDNIRNPRLHRLLSDFLRRTGCPILLMALPMLSPARYGRPCRKFAA
ncbi:MAG: carbamoyltransferase C-terminal domain-containing protein, partial [Planctomyces sp.]